MRAYNPNLSERGANIHLLITSLSYFRPLNFLSLNWYKKVESTGNRTKIVADNIKYEMSMYGRTVTILQPIRADSGIYQCEAVFVRPGSTSSLPVTAEASLIVYGQ